ncbi:hypothetical protein KY290_037616 [Solanum tuberosum]|uniref:Jacalin-type lectin domain-containing protein n=1 Tax=Solanum tuberosum TaxID=4113 RepID=A0ABQ7TW16_SOLTU|nr:hypothetical protein KY284_036976 [Solanum tuberosum]KAH0637222.1 hypothetical protein KY289_037137 [Solanum tuberosum]KAH0738911.1 hypothetical protein KY290_037616 [Solanum tuberosum]
MDTIKVGSVGGRGGSIWEEEGDELVGIFVSYGEDIVYSLQFLNYVNDNCNGIESIGFYVKNISSSHVIKLKDSPVKVKEEK